MITEALLHPVWTWITMAAVVVGLVASVWFVVRLQMEAGWSWRTNPFGRYLMTRKLLLAALFTVVLCNRLDWAWWDLLRAPVTAALMTAFAFQTFVPYRLLMAAQRAHDQGDNDTQEATR